MFKHSMDCIYHMAEGGRKNAAYLASHTIDGIKEFGAENVVQVFIDGANKAIAHNRSRIF